MTTNMTGKSSNIGHISGKLPEDALLNMWIGSSTMWISWKYSVDTGRLGLISDSSPCGCVKVDVMGDHFLVIETWKHTSVEHVWKLPLGSGFFISYIQFIDEAMCDCQRVNTADERKLAPLWTTETLEKNGIKHLSLLINCCRISQPSTVLKRKPS